MRTTLLAVLLVLSLVFVPLAATQAPDPSLQVAVPKLFLQPQNRLDANGNTTAVCGGTSGAAMTATVSFTGEPLANGSSHYLGSDVTAQVLFVASTTSPVPVADVPGPVTVMGPFRVTATLKLGNTTYNASADGTSDASASAKSLTFTFPRPTNISASSGPPVLTLVINSVPPAQGAPQNPPPNASIQCGPESFINSFTVVRGTGAGDGDNDGDGDPDSSDTDIDGDSIANAAEPGGCSFNGVPVDFINNPAAAPGDHDGDGHADDVECAKGSNPLSAASVPPPPKAFPIGLLIVGIVFLLIIGFIVWFFLSLGKGAAVTVLSAKELIIPPGGEGRYEVNVANLRKKGNPINFQLSTAGLPDGWDAKLTTDHVTLDPQGGARPSETVWLIVEAPEHADPESAVVTVKAIALNNAGRKDTLKLAGKDRVITSINVPANAKVPVRRGEAVKTRSEKEMAEAATAPTDPSEAIQPTAAAEPTPSPEPPTGKKGRKVRKTEEIPVAPTPATPTAPTPTAAATKPQLQVGGLQHAPATFKRGDEVKSSVTVTNNGNAPQSLKLSLFVNEALADAQTVSVKPGKSKAIQFKWVAQERNKLNIRGEVVGT